MTVAELIELLKQQPQDAEVWYQSADSYTNTILIVECEADWVGQPNPVVVLR